jgi:hypothetical protein
VERKTKSNEDVGLGVGMTKRILAHCGIILGMICQFGCLSQATTTNMSIRANSHLSGALTKGLYTSAQQTFSLKLPVSPHKSQISDRSEPGKEQVVIVDQYAMQFSILVTNDNKQNHDWLQAWCNSLPAEIIDPGGTRMSLNASMVTRDDNSEMALLVKGPITLPDGKVIVIHNGITVVRGKVFDFTATNHLVTAEMFGSAEVMLAMAHAQSKANFDILISTLRIHPGGMNK